MKQKNKVNGITLIALVVTIIVLLILAGVAIAMLTGENGILTQAERAKQEWENAQDLENTRLADYENKIDNYISGNRNSLINIVEIESTFDSNGKAQFNYPEGYNMDNTYIISAKAYRADQNCWHERYSRSSSTTNFDAIQLTESNIIFALKVDTLQFTTAKLLITKMD